MARHALIIDGQVRQIWDPDRPSLTAELAAQCREVAAEVEEGWLDDSTHGLIPPAPADGQVYAWDGAAWQIDVVANEDRKDQAATGRLNTPVNRTLVDLLWDLEQRMRAAGQTSSIPEIAAAADKATYKVEGKNIVKGYEP